MWLILGYLFWSSVHYVGHRLTHKNIVAHKPSPWQGDELNHHKVYDHSPSETALLDPEEDYIGFPYHKIWYALLGISLGAMFLLTHWCLFLLGFFLGMFLDDIIHRASHRDKPLGSILGWFQVRHRIHHRTHENNYAFSGFLFDKVFGTFK